MEIASDEDNLDISTCDNKNGHPSYLDRLLCISS